MRPRLLDLPNGGRTLVDADVDLGHYGWHRTSNGYVGAMTTEDGQRKMLLLHRFLMDPQPGTHVDHINGDRLDNRRENLRVATYQQNQANRKKPNRNNTSGIRGVAYRPNLSRRKPWHAQITADRRNHYLGLFATKHEAIEARRAAELEHYGEACP